MSPVGPRCRFDAAAFLRLFPRPVGAAVVRLSNSAFPLFPEEERIIKNVVEKRRIEFSAGRHCAHAAMSQLGRSPCPILFEPDRLPIWPSQIVGSITHSAQYCAAVVASDRDFHSIGIDTEPVNAVEIALAQEILRPDEISAINKCRVFDEFDWITLYFCIKEAVYKSYYKIYRNIIEFQDVRVIIQDKSRTFSAEILPKIMPRSVMFDGKYDIRQKNICVASWKCVS